MISEEKKIVSRENDENLFDEDNGLFSKFNLKKIMYCLLSLIGIPLIMNFLTSLRSPMNDGGIGLPPSNQPPMDQPPSGNLNPISPPGDSLHQNSPLGNIMVQNPWPIWGTIMIPSLFEMAFGTGIFILIGFITFLIMKYYNSKGIMPNIVIILLVGTLSIILTNLIHGWEIGIFMPIGGETEIYSDAINVSNIITFMQNYNDIQQTLSVHAQTQPPGAVLIIYMYYLIFNEPATISIALCITASILSGVFLYGIFKHYFDADLAKYGIFTFLLLPAVQVYYLANIYAIVATLIFGALFCYLSENRYIKIIGTTVFTWILTFTSFLSVWFLLFIVIYELFNNDILQDLKNLGNRENSLKDFLKKCVSSYKHLIIIVISIVSIYLGLYLTLGFNYIESFLFASSLENPNGFMLFSSPLEYIITRLQDIFDILIFIGPVIIILFVYGWSILKKETEMGKKEIYVLVLSAILSLLILFLTGAPKKGETARICMFILPFLLLPVLKYLDVKKINGNERLKLIIIIFAQSVLMQTIGIYVW